ncbi:MAG TPA: sulfite exporter TauE/SafE family protein [Rhodobacteraceae bacterium]|nr:sulfite exporter TauE/SafE family protein [Paracoccaceae bacterium]
MDISALQAFYIALAAFLVGFTKTSVGGVGILAVLLMALAIPGKASPGVLLPMLIAADLMAVLYYRRSCQWRILLRLLPLTVVGVGVGYLILRALPDTRFERVIGTVILAMLALDLGMNDALRRHMSGRVMTGTAGVLAGAASMLANAAGPVFGIYLLQMGLTKSEFVGTRSWFFLVMNVVKLPFAAQLGLITLPGLALDLTFLPVILIGAVVGVKVLKYINIDLFKWLIRTAALVAALRLIIG